MEFIQKVELFFIQLQYCLAIQSEPMLQGEKGLYSLMLEPEIFFKLINDFHIEHPFNSENKIIELQGLMIKENINTNHALKVIENFKKYYWFLDTVVMFEPLTDKLKLTLKSINSEISENEINIELMNFQKYLQEKREGIYLNLITEIKALTPEQTKTEKEQPKMFEELFYDSSLILGCIDILKQVDPPLIDAENNYIGKSKGAFCVWIDEMQRQGIVKHYSDRKVFALLLPKVINRFTIDESMFGKNQVGAEKKYRTDIKTLLSQIKLSQNSHKGALGK